MADDKKITASEQVEAEKSTVAAENAMQDTNTEAVPTVEVKSEEILEESKAISSKEEKSPEISQPVENPNDEKKSGGRGFFFTCLIVLVLCIIVCCVAVCGVAIFSPQIITNAISGSSTGRDTSLTRLSKEELETLEANYKATENVTSLSEVTFGEVEKVGNKTKVVLTEQELLATIISVLPAGTDVQEFGVDINPTRIKIEMGMKALLGAAGSEVDQTTLSTFEDTYLSFEIAPTASGDSLQLVEFSTGNSLLDSLIPEDYKNEVRNSFTEGFTQEVPGQTISSIKLGEGTVEFIYE